MKKVRLGLVDCDSFIGVVTDDDRLVARINFDDDLNAEESHKFAKELVERWNNGA